MMRGLLSGAALGTVFGMSTAAAEAACGPGKPGSELTCDEAQAVYDGIAAELQDGYATGDKKCIPADMIENYRDWTRPSSFPAAPGFHGERFLVTRMNETGADAYMRYAESPSIPAGTLIAKEFFSVNDAGEVRKGPLFFMRKVEAGVSSEADDWYDIAVAPNGTPMAIDVLSACSECHQGMFGNQGGLGYPVEEARVAR